MFKSKSKGFTLLELVLVLGVGASITFMKFQDMVNDQEYTQARLAGEQIKQLGDAVNKYISIRYDKISTLNNAAGTGTDPGPRTCSSTTNVCAITYQTLVNEGLLPTTYSGMNNFRSGYNITLKRTGAAPNYIINGLVSTSGAWINNGKVRYDLLGRAIQSAGIDSGMSKSTTQADGYNGMWTASFADYGVSAPAGILTYRVGYDSALYSIYLRRDGTLPMTGDLDMGNHDIDNAKNITASGGGQFGGNVTTNGIDPNDLPTGWSGGIRSTDMVASATIAVVPYGKTASSIGATTDMATYMDRFGNIGASNSIYSAKTISAGTTINAGGEITAHNGYGDAISLGGDAAGGDYEIRLGSNKPLTVYSPSATQYSTVMNVNRNMVVNERFATNGLSPNDIPSGYLGGIRTFDIIATGTIGMIKAGTAATAGNWAGYINNAGNIYASGNLNLDHDAYINGTINSGGDINVGKRLNAYEYIYLNGEAVQGTSCSKNGLIGRTKEGKMISCLNGIWTQNTYTYNTYSVSFNAPTSGSGSQYQSTNMGNHLACFITGNQEQDGLTKHIYVSHSGTNWTLEQRVTLWPAGIQTWAYATCID